MDKKVLNTLERLCSRREYCSKDVYQKALKLLDGDEHQASEMLAFLVKEKYVDDLRYASAFARDKATFQGWGPVKIGYMLRAKGIASDTIKEALSEIDTAKADEKLKKVLQTKYKSLQGDPQWRLKLIKFALGRGYDYDSVSKLLAELQVPESVPFD